MNGAREEAGAAGEDAVFARALAFVLESEGGLADDPRDPGGRTNLGISQRAWPGLDVAGLDRAGAAALYRREYWDRPGLGALPPALAAAVFDAAVNCGPRRAGELAQAALNRLGAGLVVDGRIGPRTIRAARSLDQDQARRLVAELCLERTAHYVRLAASQDRRPFLLGWLRRVLALRELCSVLAGGGHDRKEDA